MSSAQQNKTNLWYLIMKKCKLSRPTSAAASQVLDQRCGHAGLVGYIYVDQVNNTHQQIIKVIVSHPKNNALLSPALYTIHSQYRSLHFVHTTSTGGSELSTRPKPNHQPPHTPFLLLHLVYLRSKFRVPKAEILVVSIFLKFGNQA